MDRDTIISLATLPDSRTRATVSGFFLEAQGQLEVLPLLSAGCSPEDRITQGLVTKFVNIAVCIAGDSESVDGVAINSNGSHYDRSNRINSGDSGRNNLNEREFCDALAVG